LPGPLVGCRSCDICGRAPARDLKFGGPAPVGSLVSRASRWRGEYGQYEQGNTGELFGALAQRLVQTRSEAEPDLGEEERLHADQNDCKPEREVEQADREGDREFVEAD
jgi:hypothetical protein